MIRSMAAAWAAAALALGATAAAEPRSDQAPGCPGPLDAAAVVRCALGSSPEVQTARAELAALAGRRRAAGVWLPSNPVVAGTISRRRTDGGGAAATNWSATLSQELELAGQRGARLEVADAEAAAQLRRVAVAEQEVAAHALGTYYEAVAAREALVLARELAASGAALAAAAEARAREALLSGIDADVARAEAVRLGALRVEAERRSGVARAALAILVGARPDSEVAGALAPPPAELPPEARLESEALRLRGEIAAADMERLVMERQVALLERERIPNVTLSAFAERDAFAERVLGLGLSVPLPLPAPVGRTRAGELEATRAQRAAAAGSLEQIRRRVRLEVAQALAGLRARQGTLALFQDDLLARARTDLAALREGIASRQLTLREALAAQRSLIELLQAHLEARLAHALAWVELRRVVGLPLGGRP
jgi:cobalt-zinc-cadmium efflux system outer membrane protein